MNISHTERYKTWRKEQDYIFVPQYRYPQIDKTVEFDNGFSVVTRGYRSCTQPFMMASINQLLDSQERVLYTWRNLDIDGEFCSLLRHQNGRHYLVFRIELYGYSVYEVESGKEMHYVPSQVYPEEGRKGQEVFIWTGADYDSESNLLAVSGCIWACPYSTIVHPLDARLAEQWMDIHQIIDPQYCIYDDIDFNCWENGALVLRGNNTGTSQWEEIRLSKQVLRGALNSLDFKIES